MSQRTSLQGQNSHLTAWALTFLLSLGAFGSGCPNGGGNDPLPPPALYEISPNTKPLSPTRGNAPDGRLRAVGAVQGETGSTTDFVTDEVVLSGISSSALQEFVSRTGGKILAGDQPLPAPPSGNAVAIDPALRTYTVRVDLSKVSLDTFDNDLSVGMQASGKFRISSLDAAKLLALVAREKVAGVPIAPNLVFYGDAGNFITAANEDPRWGASRTDALTWAENANTGSKTEMRRAWQFMEAREANLPEARRTKIAIIDGGFHLNAQGHPIHCASEAAPCELPWTPIQYDLVARSRIANRMGDAVCGGGGACPWHGLSSALSAVAKINNGLGGAGSGSQASVPILLASDLTAGSVNESVLLAVHWGAQVISMSFSGGCDNIFCEAFYDLSGVNGAMGNATSRGVVLLAAAGNGNSDVDASKRFPCAYGDVICIGATEESSQNRIGYSNWGRTRVDLWAPTNIHALQPTADASSADLDYAGGTSSATPFVAGVVGMMKQVNPALTVAETLRILQDTAWRDSPDPRVTHSLNAYRAVLSAANSSLPADLYEPNDTETTARTLVFGTNDVLTDYGFLTIGSLTDVDFYRFINPQFAKLTIELDSIPDVTGFMRAGIWMGDGTFPTGCTTRNMGTNLNTYRIECDWLPPGVIHLRVSADHPSGYQLRIKRLDRGAVGPDAFEVNNTLATAAVVTGQGPHSATFHLPSDTDYYQIAAPTGTNTLFTYNFDVNGVSTERYRIFAYPPGSNSPIEAGRGNSTFGMNTPGNWRMQVIPYTPGTTNFSSPYTFSLSRRYSGPMIDRGVFSPYPSQGFRWLDPNSDTGPLAGRLAEQAEYFAFQNVSKFKAIEFWGSELQIELLNPQGILIGLNQPSANPQIPDLQRLDCQGLQTNGYYVVRVKRPANVDVNLELGFWMRLSAQ